MLRANLSALQSLRNLISSIEDRKSSTRLNNSVPSLHLLCQVKQVAPLRLGKAKSWTMLEFIQNLLQLTVAMAIIDFQR